VLDVDVVEDELLATTLPLFFDLLAGLDFRRAMLFD